MGNYISRKRGVAEQIIYCDDMKQKEGETEIEFLDRVILSDRKTKQLQREHAELSRVLEVQANTLAELFERHSKLEKELDTEIRERIRYHLETNGFPMELRRKVWEWIVTPDPIPSDLYEEVRKQFATDPDASESVYDSTLVSDPVHSLPSPPQ